LAVTGLLVLLALLAHALITARLPDGADEPAAPSDRAQATSLSVVPPLALHDYPDVGVDRLETDRALAGLSAVEVSGSDALKYPTRLQALVGQGHAVVAAPFSGRPLDGLTPRQRDIELAATQLALAGIIGSEARWVRCAGDGGALAFEARLAERALRCAPLPTQAASDSAAPSPAAPIDSLRPASPYRKALGAAMRGLLTLIDAGLRGALVITLVLFGVFLLRFVWVAWLMLARARRQARLRLADAADAGELPSVTVIVPAYNEEAVVVATVRSLLACSYPSAVQIVVVDDGSTDSTYAVAVHAFESHPQVSVLTKPNGGKCTALNLGMAQARTDIVVCIDADTQLDSEALRLLCRHFRDPQVGAVAGQPKVGNRRNFITRVQALEYVVLNSVERQAMEGCNAITCVAGAIGAYRKTLIERLGGYASDTLAEDTDMTLRILRSGARIVYEDQAIAWTESPETLRDFMKQRFRWMFGTAQVAFKNRASLLAVKQGSFGMVAMPNLLLLQVGAGCLLLPIVDTVPVAAVFWLCVGDWMGWLFPRQRELLVALDHQLLWYGLFGLMTLAAIGMSAVALRLDRLERLRSLAWLLPMQMCLRALLGMTAYRCIGRMLTGRRLAWGSLQRTGHVALTSGRVQRARAPAPPGAAT
jgi:cellulose synthase/poly-beta-1,6-N-acetylglucosamine synthase-like glycosyltransferase